MKKQTTYRNAPKSIAKAIEQSTVIENFLPAPDELIFKEDTVKVTINLNKSSVAFFKKSAKQLGIPYQKMIKRVIDIYVNHYQQV